MPTRPNLFDPALLRLRHNGECDWYQGWVTVAGGEAVRFTLHLDGATDVEPRLAVARRVLGDALWPVLRGRAVAAACETLLPVLNALRAAAGGSQVSATEFARRLNVHTVLFTKSDVEFWFQPGPWLGGRLIRVRFAGDDVATVELS